MWKSCPRCGKIHDSKYPCKKPQRIYPGGDERRLRSSYRWSEKSKEIRDKAQYLCEVCRDKENRFVYDGVEVHHIIKLKDGPSEAFDNYNLVCLCQEHHKAADAGQISKEYLRSLAYRREHRFDSQSQND